jgi:hypothetical protein
MASEPEHISTILPRVMPLILTLPEPPSSNRWWRMSGKGRNHLHLSDEAREYKAAVAAQAGVNGATLFPEEALSVVVVWCRSKKMGDLDKRLGIILDALQEIRKLVPAPTKKNPKHKTAIVLAPGVYATDGQIVQIWARRCDAHSEIPKGHMRIEICPTPVEA